MKALIMALLLSPIVANADVVAKAPRKAGGEIVLTNEQANCPQGFKSAFIHNNAGAVVFGCWTTYDNFVVVRYEDGDRMMYQVGAFTMMPKYDKPKGTSL